MIYYLLFFLLLSVYNFNPLSQSSNAVATFYEPYDSGASCGFGVPKIYGAALDDKIYNHGEKWDIFYVWACRPKRSCENNGW